MRTRSTGTVITVFIIPDRYTTGTCTIPTGTFTITRGATTQGGTGITTTGGTIATGTNQLVVGIASGQGLGSRSQGISLRASLRSASGSIGFAK